MTGESHLHVVAPGAGGGVGIPPISTATVQSLGCTLSAYAGYKRLPEAFLKELGLSDMSHQGSPALRIPYWDASGAEPAVRFRMPSRRVRQVTTASAGRAAPSPSSMGSGA